MSDNNSAGTPGAAPSDLRLRGLEAVSSRWQEIAASPHFVFDGLRLLDASGAEVAYSAGRAWLRDDGAKMLGLAFEAGRSIGVRAVGRGGPDLVFDAAGAVRVNGAYLVAGGRDVLALDRLGRWSEPSDGPADDLVWFRVVVIG